MIRYLGQGLTIFGHHLVLTIRKPDKNEKKLDFKWYLG
jgi:hypothetical protein